MNIAIVGTGYVGLVTGTCFAETGNHVICVDIDKEKIDSLCAGLMPIYEPGLHVIFERNIRSERLKFTTKLALAVEKSDLIFLALPTPPGEDGSADLSYILRVAGQLSGMISKYKVIIDKSTVPVGTAEKVESVLAEKLPRHLFDVVSNPEFLREGVAVSDFMKPDRIVVGHNSDKAAKMMAELYKPFVRQGNPIYFMDLRSAEMTKYAANSYLATRISFMNEIANLCDLTGANVDMVRLGMGSDSRIGKRFLFPGVGYGGSCFPKDVQALVKTAKDYDYDFSILQSVTEVNERQKKKAFELLIREYGDQLEDKVIAVWGLSFKPDTDDIREAPALSLLESLTGNGNKINVFDPEAMKNIERIYGEQLYYAPDPYDALKGSDVLVIMTEWSIFRNPEFELMSERIRDKMIIDGRNLFDPAEMKERGFKYLSIGRPLKTE